MEVNEAFEMKGIEFMYFIPLGLSILIIIRKSYTFFNGIN